MTDKEDELKIKAKIVKQSTFLGLEVTRFALDGNKKILKIPGDELEEGLKELSDAELEKITEDSEKKFIKNNSGDPLAQAVVNKLRLTLTKRQSIAGS